MSLKRASLIFICETKLRDLTCRRWRDVLGYSGLFVVNCEGRSGGLMLLWKEPLIVTIQSFTSGHIDSLVQHGEKRWRFTGFYGNPEASNRHLSWTLLRRLSCMYELRDFPWIVGGDFNEICFDTEKFGGPLAQTGGFREVLDVASLQDFHAEG